jgi:hypothetical protein
MCVESRESPKMSPALAVQTASKEPDSPQFRWFQSRREHIGKKGLEIPRTSEEIRLGEARVRVTSSVIDLADYKPPSKEHEKPFLKLTVMNAGLFEATDLLGLGTGQGNTGNTELKLAGGLFDNSLSAPDALVFIKPEGLNAAAYDRGETTIGTATALKLEQIASEYKRTHHLPPDLPVVFDLTGFSEGSSQIVSTAAELLRRNIGKVERVFSIGGAGYVGAQEVEQAKPIEFIRQAFLAAMQARKNPQPLGFYDETSRDVHVSGKPIENMSKRLTQTLTGMTGEQIKLMDDLRNVYVFFRRLTRSLPSLDLEDPTSAVPIKRIKAACSLNEDRLFLAAQSVPTTIFADYDDPFFPPSQIKPEVDRLRATSPTAKIQFITSALGHAGPHNEQTSFNWLINTLESIPERKQKT